MTSARAKEVLYDSETVLRLVDSELAELRDPMPIAESPVQGDVLAAIRRTIPDRTATKTLPPDASLVP